MVDGLTANWISIIVGLVGLFLGAIGIWLTMRWRARARLVYQSRNVSLVGQPDSTPHGEIKILFNGAAVPRVTVSHLALWNAGNTTIRGADIVESDPLRICFEEGTTILGTRSVGCKRPVNGLLVAINQERPSEAYLRFDYLDGGDGGIFEILHTGAGKKPVVKGAIRGIRNGVEDRGALLNPEDKDWMAEARSWFGIFLLLAISLGSFVGFFGWPKYRGIASLFFIAGALFLALFGALSLGRMRRAPKALWRTHTGETAQK